MENPNNFTLETEPGDNKLFMNILKILAVAGIALILGLIAWRFVANLNFRMSGTSPTTNNVGDYLPFIDVQFNRELAKGVEATSKPDIIVKTERHGKTFRIFFNNDEDPLDHNKHIITIKNITSTKGEKLPDQKLTFEPRDMTMDEMPKAQRDFLMKRQANKPASPDNIVLDNISDLQDQGLEPDQEQSFRVALYNFDPKAKVTRITSPVRALDAQQAQEQNKQAYFFNMQIGEKKYKVELDCLDLSVVQVFLSDMQGKQVYDSGVIDYTGGD